MSPLQSPEGKVQGMPSTVPFPKKMFSRVRADARVYCNAPQNAGTRLLALCTWLRPLLPKGLWQMLKSIVANSEKQQPGYLQFVPVSPFWLVLQQKSNKSACIQRLKPIVAYSERLLGGFLPSACTLIRKKSTQKALFAHSLPLPFQPLPTSGLVVEWKNKKILSSLTIAFCFVFVAVYSIFFFSLTYNTQCSKQVPSLIPTYYPFNPSPTLHPSKYGEINQTKEVKKICTFL